MVWLTFTDDELQSIEPELSIEDIKTLKDMKDVRVLFVVIMTLKTFKFTLC